MEMSICKFDLKYQLTRSNLTEVFFRDIFEFLTFKFCFQLLVIYLRVGDLVSDRPGLHIRTHKLLHLGNVS